MLIQFGIFAGLALFLVVAYGVVSYLLSRRTHEMGIRIALGASRGDVLRLVPGRGLAATVVGLALGIAASLPLTRLIAGLLFPVKPTHPPAYITVALILTTVALVACYIPARRATCVDPLVALRHDWSLSGFEASQSHEHGGTRTLARPLLGQPLHPSPRAPRSAHGEQRGCCTRDLGGARRNVYARHGPLPTRVGKDGIQLPSFSFIQ